MLKIAPNYGSTIVFTLKKTNTYWKNVIKMTVIHSTVSCICFSIAFMTLIYGLLFSDTIMLLISINSFIFLLMQLQLTGMGPAYLWNVISRNLSSNNYISYFLMRLIILNIAFILFTMRTYNKNAACATAYKVIFYAIISTEFIDFFINCLNPSQKVIFFLFNTSTIVQNLLFIAMVCMLLVQDKKEIPYSIQYWLPIFALNGLKHGIDILTVTSHTTFLFFNKDIYLMKYLSFFVFITPILLTTIQNIRTKFKNLRDKLKEFEKKSISDDIDNAFYISTIHQLIDMNAMAINALNMPELKFETYDSKEIKNLMQYNLVKSQAFLNTTLQMRSKKNACESNIMLQSFFMSCITHIETMAKLNHIKLNVRSSITQDYYLRTNPYILQLVFASLATSVIKLTASDSILNINLSFENDILHYALQNEMPAEEQKFLKKILSKYSSTHETGETDVNTYEFEMIHRACKLYNGNLSIKPLTKGVQFTAEMHIPHLKTMENSDAIYEKSFYNPDLNKDKTPIPIKLPFSHLKKDPLSIFIAEDNLVNISYFKNMLQEYGIVKTASSGLEAWNALNESRMQPDIIIAEYNLPLLSGFELFKKCKNSFELQNIPFIMLLQSSDYDKMQELYITGVSSCLVKPFATIDFFNQISSVLSTTYKAKNSVLNNINRAVINNQSISLGTASVSEKKQEHADSLFEKANLSPRERQIATLISVGRSDKEIAEELNISPATVATHNKNIFKKLSVHSRIELINKVQ